jgi:hypothetical protein
MTTTNQNNGYTDARMNLNEVCNWLTAHGHGYFADAIADGFTSHAFTKDGYIRKDVVRDLFSALFTNEYCTQAEVAEPSMFRKLECDVATMLNVVPAYEAHVD